LPTAMDILTTGNIRKVVVNENVVFEEKTEAPQSRPGSWGNETTQRFNEITRDLTKEHLESCKEFSRVEHVGGVEKGNPAEGIERKKEIWLQDPSRKGTKGGRRMDISLLVDYKDERCLVHVNTADFDEDNAEYFLRELLA